MRAVLLDAPGPPSSLRIGELADPTPSSNEVLVRVRAASLNPVDFKVAAVGSELWRYPHLLGVDASGIIEQTGANVTDWRAGDRVLFHATGNGLFRIICLKTGSHPPRRMSSLQELVVEGAKPERVVG